MIRRSRSPARHRQSLEPPAEEARTLRAGIAEFDSDSDASVPGPGPKPGDEAARGRAASLATADWDTDADAGQGVADPARRARLTCAPLAPPGAGVFDAA